MYNRNSQSYEPIDDEYQSSIRQGIRMARQQATQDLFSIPLHGAEAAQ
jgi:hypothetical protein